MGRSRARRTAAILAACIAVHVALLSVLAIEATGSRSAEPPDQPAIQVTLERPPAPRPAHPKPPPRPRARNAALAPQPSPAPVVHQAPPSIQPSAPAVDSGAAAAMGDLVRALRGSVGCSDPDAVGLSEAEKAACRRRLHAQGENVQPMLGLTEEKRNRFDRAVRCRKDYYDAPIPQGNSKHNEPNDLVGLGQTPRLRDCPPSDQ